MSKFSFGAYVAGTSFLHRLDARVGFACMAATTYCALACNQWQTLGVLAALEIVALAIARIPLAHMLRGLLPVTLILGVTLLFNALSFASPQDGIPVIGALSFTPAGCLAGLRYVLRMGICVVAAAILTFTTSPLELSSGLGRVLQPLKRWGVPAEDVSLVVSLVLRFIPIIADEAYVIKDAQACRGARFGKGGPYARIKAWVPVLIPLVIRLFRQGDNLARTLEARLYGYESRQIACKRPMGFLDWGILVGYCGAAIAMGVLL